MGTRQILALLNPLISTSSGRSRPITENSSRPAFARQVARLQPQFTTLQASFEQLIRLQVRPEGAEPEQVIVLETIGTVDEFVTATRNVAGMELLGEWDELDVPPDDDFFKLNADREKVVGDVSGRLYLIMTNQVSMRQLLSLWNQYQKDPAFVFPRGTTKFRDIFERLKTVRLWGPEDRISELGGIAIWSKELLLKPGQQLTMQIELWFSNSLATRAQRSSAVSKLVAELGGHVKEELVLDHIRYHGLLVTLPPSVIESLIRRDYIRLIQYEHIMFVKAAAQHVAPTDSDGFESEENFSTQEENQQEPIIAMLDGLPLENHKLLANKLIVDDPDDAASLYTARERNHGTSMASLIIHGDLNAQSASLQRRIYVRPILSPSPNSQEEYIAENKLPLGVLQEAIERLYETDEEKRAAAPSVRIINLSVCDSARPYDFYPSPLARLLDWLSHKYNVLFIVSAGNCRQALPLTKIDDNDAMVQRTLKHIASDLRNRRILSPGESLNSLTIGALHADSSDSVVQGSLFDALPVGVLPSTISAAGFGFRRSIKPELLLPGGKQLYMPKIFEESSSQSQSQKFGLKAAAPGLAPGEISRVTGVRGTSGATALATNRAGKLFEALERLSNEKDFLEIKKGFLTVILKALMVHDATWGDSLKAYEKALKTSENSRRFKEYVGRFLGYGYHSNTPQLTNSDQRATMLGWGEIGNTEINTFVIPLPPCLAGKKVWKRLTVSLAWLTPINSGNRAYRKAALSFAPPHSLLGLTRQNADHNAVQRGTVQHEVLEGEEAIAFKKGDSLVVEIACKSPTDDLKDEKIKYGLAVTLEVEEGTSLPVWLEIKEILIETRQRVAVRA